MNFLNNFLKGANKKEVISWAFFDFANSSYSTLIISLAFPIYFKDVIASGPASDFYWGLVISLSIFIGGVASPFIGAMTDYDGKKKKRFILFTLLSIIGTALLYFTGKNQVIFASFIFILANIFFELAITLYNSFLSDISSKETVGRISGLGWGLGYLGGITAMLILYPFYKELGPSYKLTFPLTALFFLIFSIPSVVFIRKDKSIKKSVPLKLILKKSSSNVLSVFRKIKHYKNIAWFLVGFYFINDVLVTLFAFIPIYAKTTLNFTIKEIFIIFLIIQIIALPGTIFFGWLSDRKSPKKILLFCTLMWCFIIVIISVANSKSLFYIAAILAGLFVGSIQSVARSWFSGIIPKNRETEFFGFSGLMSKVSATTGPLIFGIVSSITGNQRFAMIALLPFFIISFFIFLKVKEKSLVEYVPKHR